MTWEDVTGQPTADIAKVKNAYTVRVTCTDEQLAALQADPQYVVIWSTPSGAKAPTTLAKAATDKLKSSLASHYTSDVVDFVVKSDPAQLLAALVACQKNGDKPAPDPK
jgi:hypothetical protein